MWGLGGRYHWGRREQGEKVEGIVVVFAWMFSQERHLSSYVKLYSSLGWISLVCYPEFLNSFFPEKATDLAVEVLSELVKELKVRPCPVVLASFSGGPKACMYKVLQIIEGKCDGQQNLEDFRLVRDCISGHIYDSSPVDFVSDLGTKLLLHPTVLKMSRPPRLASWIAHGVASGLDTLFLSRFESQRAEYWQTLYSSVSMKAPYLILCSEKDDLAPYEVICNFAKRVQDLGGDIKLVKWVDSPHVGHYRHYPVDYKAAVTEFLGKAATVYSQRIRRLEGEGMGIEGSQNENPERVEDLRKAMKKSNNFHGITPGASEVYLAPSSMECYDGKDVGSVQDERKEDLIHLRSPPSINAHGVLGQILFDACVPRDVEDWDIRSSSSIVPLFPSSRRQRHTPFNPIKCIRRSRL